MGSRLQWARRWRPIPRRFAAIAACAGHLGLCSRLTPTSWSSNGSTIRAERLRMNV